MIRSLTPDSIIKVVNALCKSLNDTERRQVTQYLIKKNFNWIPNRKIAELTGFKCHGGITRNVKAVESNKELLMISSELNDIFKTSYA